MRKKSIDFALSTLLFALCSAGALLFALCTIAEAQQPKVYRIGMLINGTPSSHKFMVDEFQQGLRDLGYLEQKKLSS